MSSPSGNIRAGPYWGHDDFPKKQYRKREGEIAVSKVIGPNSLEGTCFKGISDFKGRMDRNGEVQEVQFD